METRKAIGLGLLGIAVIHTLLFPWGAMLTMSVGLGVVAASLGTVLLVIK